MHPPEHEYLHQDIRDTDIYKEVQSICASVRQPGAGLVHDAVDVSAAANGKHIAFCGLLSETLESNPAARICVVDAETKDLRIVTYGPGIDRLPRFSPDGRTIAFLSDRHRAGDFQLFILDIATGAARSTPRVEGWVEYLHWAPHGDRVLLGVAGHGADISGGQGAIRSSRDSNAVEWMPLVDSGEGEFRWRHLWLYDLNTNEVTRVTPDSINAWEACWCGNDALSFVSSPGPSEDLWYSATLSHLELASCQTQTLYTPGQQLGWPSATPSGHLLAIVEAKCSDRWIVAGELRLIDAVSGDCRKIDTHGIDVSYVEWRSETKLLLAGHRGCETVVGIHDIAGEKYRDVWSSEELTSVGRYVSVSGIGENGDCALIGEGFLHAPEVGRIRTGEYETVRSLDVGFSEWAQNLAEIENLEWSAPDGVHVQGWLAKPMGATRTPILLNVHGGPVWHWRPAWLGRSSGFMLALLKRGYSVFFPNPRGSIGWGQAFIEAVYGDPGGKDAQDILSGLDALVDRGHADPERIAVMGGSYGGFMTSWLITQDHRFACAISVSPHTNQFTERLLSNIPTFVDMLMADSHTDTNGRYFSRSPIMHAGGVQTPVLNVCGAQDACTPPEEAVQFHRAVLESGTRSILLTYPLEGHGVRSFPACIDFGARAVGWIEHHCGSGI
jgi:dipeptidyl aminopeptidase/acylaminoacyl peptidase